jgi:hypothetical protein
MTRVFSLASLFFFSFVPLSPLDSRSPQEKPARKLEWKTPKTKALVYSFLEKGKPSKDREFVVFGSELATPGNRIAVDRYADLAWPFLFQLPPEPFKSALPGWEYSPHLFTDASSATAFALLGGASGIKPLAVRGRFQVKGVQKKEDDEIVTIDGAFTFFEIRRDFVNNQVSLTVTKNTQGTLATSAQVSLSRGLLLKAGYQFKVRGEEREPQRVNDRQFTVHEMVELQEEVDLDPEKLKPSFEAGVKKASEWLRKQQKPAGTWGTPRPGEGTIDAGATGLALRALLASGSAPDDPALVSAAKALRVPPPPETWDLSQQIQALAARGPSKEEADDLRRLADELLRRRDLRTSLWGPGGRNESLTCLSTAAALEALAAFPEARVPDDVWKAVFDRLTGSWIEAAKEIELDLEFEKDAAPIEPDPKKVVPCAWPPDFGRKGGADLLQLRAARRGSALTQLSVLSTLLLLRDRLKLDAVQTKSLDAALRKGLAQVQAEWTLRAVPPVEGPWSLQRPEYLELLSRALGRARCLKVAGADWRLEGALLLLRDQAEDGSWGSGEAAVSKTSHALLFLAAALR